LTFPEFYIRQLSNPESTGEVNYSIVWERFAKVFGRDSLRIVSFNNLLDRGVDLFQHFCEEVVGVHDVPKIARGLIQRNAGPDMVDSEIMRALNYLYYLATSRTDQTMRIKFDRVKQRYDLRTLREHVNTDTRQMKLKDNAAPLRTTWEAISAYKDRLVSPQYGRQIFEQCTVEAEFVGQNYLLREGVLDELASFYDFLKSEEVYSPELQALQKSMAAG
jgi:hypothetical protein